MALGLKFQCLGEAVGKLSTKWRDSHVIKCIQTYIYIIHKCGEQYGVQE